MTPDRIRRGGLTIPPLGFMEASSTLLCEPLKAPRRPPKGAGKGKLCSEATGQARRGSGQGPGLQVAAGWLLVALLGVGGAGHCWRPWRRDWGRWLEHPGCSDEGRRDIRRFRGLRTPKVSACSVGSSQCFHLFSFLKNPEWCLRRVTLGQEPCTYSLCFSFSLAG